MNKAKKYAQNGAVVLGIGNALVNACNQMGDNSQNKKFDWFQLFTAASKGALIGGTAGFVLGTIRDNEMSTVLIKYKSVPNYLHKSLGFFKDENTLLVNKAEMIKSKLQDIFINDLAQKPTLVGSIEKGTSIKDSDIDIQLTFKKESGTIEDVYYSVSDSIYNDLSVDGITNIRSQMHSVGIELCIDGEMKRIDIVPTLQIKKGKNDVQLFVNKRGFFEKPTYKKTNPVKQLSLLTFNDKEKRIIRLLKVWKLENNLNIKSIHIEYLAKKAFAYKPVTNRIENDLANVISFIASNIEHSKLLDPGNSNNIISNSLNSREKEIISTFCFKMLENLRKDKRNIIDYFPSLEL